jgi:hypothetical protein
MQMFNRLKFNTTECFLYCPQAGQAFTFLLDEKSQQTPKAPKIRMFKKNIGLIRDI